MKKRAIEGDHMSREQFESRDDSGDEDNDPGHFARADDQELAGRKRLTLKKRDSSSSAGAGAVPNPFASAFGAKPAATSNPFASTVLTTPAPTTQPSNPFKGFNELTAPSPSASLPSFGGFQPASVAPAVSFAPPSTATSTATAAGNSTTSNNSSSSNSEFQKKMKKLNESFLRWAERQVKENAVAIWKDGVKDYLKHQEALRQKYGVTDDNDQPANSVPAAVKVDAPKAATSSFSFSAAPPAASSAPKTNPVAPPAAPAAETGSKPSAFSLPTTTATNTSSDSADPKSFSFALPTAAPSAASTSTEAPKSFSFSLPATVPATTGSAAPFSFGAPAATPASTGAFNFSLPTAAPATNPFGATSGFSAPANPFAVKATPAAPQTGEDGEGGEGGDEEGEPILAPEKVLRNDQDKDEIVLEVPCKLFNYNKTDNEWKDTGKGNLRVTQDPATKKKRMVMRNGTGKIVLNAAFFKTFKVEKVKTGLKFSAFVAHETTGDTEFKMFMLKLNDANAEKLKAEMEKAVQELQ